MSHDLRNALGYRHIPASDPEEQRLRDLFFAARGKHVEAGQPFHGPEYAAMAKAERILADYLWERTCRIIEEDRRKHPKARRNAPVGSALPGTSKTGKADIPHIEGFTQPDPRGL